MSSTSLDYPVSSLQENPRPNGQVLTPRRGGHDIPSAVRLPDHRWRHDLTLGLEVQESLSAHPSAATRHRACHDAGPVTPIPQRIFGCILRLSSKPWHGVPATNASTGAFSRAERTRRCVGGTPIRCPSCGYENIF